MVTLNRIADNIAYKLGEPNNDILKQSIKNEVIQYRELFIRRDLERNPLDYNRYLSTVCLELEEVDTSACPNLPVGVTALRTKQKLAIPLRMKNNGATNFKYVGEVNLRRPYTFSPISAIDYMEYLPLSSKNIYYDFINNHIEVYNLHHICKIAVRYIPSDPRDIDDCNNPNLFKDDIEFPLSNDMIAEISRLIEEGHRVNPNNGEEVNIDEND